MMTHTGENEMNGRRGAWGHPGVLDDGVVVTGIRVGHLVYVMRVPYGAIRDRRRWERMPGMAWRVVSVNRAHGTLWLRSVDYGTLSSCPRGWFEQAVRDGWLHVEAWKSGTP